MMIRESDGYPARPWRWLWSVTLFCIVIAQLESTEALPFHSPFCRHVVFPLGYSCKEYQVITSDGFVLALHRISTWYVARSTVNKTAAEPAAVKSIPPPVTTTEGKSFQGGSPQMVVTDRNTSAISSASTEPFQDVEQNLTNGRESMEAVTTPVSKELEKEQAFQAASAAQVEVTFKLHRKFLHTMLTTSPLYASTPTSVPRPLRQRGSPVLIMHPEFLNGDSWFTPTYTPGDKLLPLLMADEGYDVWVGHNRATLWGHDHVFLEPNHREYWNWTWDDHAQHDLPTMLTFINKETQSTVHYIGVSQSATSGAAAVTRPLVASLVKSMTLVGPTIYRGNTNSLILEAWAYIFGSRLDQRYYTEGFQNGAFNYSLEFPLDLIYGQGPMAVVLDTISAPNLITFEFLSVNVGPNCCLGYAVIRFDNGWDGTTPWKNLLHFQQGVRSNKWQHFDYGSLRLNANAYNGSTVPPAYNPGDIPANLPVFVVYGLRDTAAPASGVHTFLSLLRSKPTSLSLPMYAHYDLTYSVNRTQDIFYPILKFIRTHDDSVAIDSANSTTVVSTISPPA